MGDWIIQKLIPIWDGDVIALFKGALATIGVRAALLATNVALGVLLARVMGPSEYGTYAYVYSLVLVLTIPAVLGVPTVLLRESANALATRSWSHLRGLLRWGWATVSVSAAVVVIISVMTVSFAPVEWRHHYGTPFLFALLLIPLSAYIVITTDFVRGLHKTIVAQLPILARQILLLLFALVLYTGLDKDLSASLVLILQSAAALSALILASLAIFRNYPYDARTATPIYLVREWLKPAFAFALIGIIQMINNRADVIMLGSFLAPDAVGVYEVAFRGAELIVFLQIAVNTASASTYSRLATEKNLDALAHIVTMSVRAVSTITIPIAAALLVWTEEIVSFVFGDAYLNACLPMRILIIGQICNVLLGPSDLLLNMTGNERIAAVGVLIAAIANVGLNVVLIPRYGIEGACIGTVVSLFLWNALLLILARRRVGIDTSVVGAALIRR